MTERNIHLNVLLIMSILLTIGSIGFFVDFLTQQNNNTSEVIYTQSSISSVTSSRLSNDFSSTLSSSSSSLISSISSISSSSVESSSSSSLNSIVLENNLSIINDIELIIEKPNPEIQAKIKAAKDRPKVETKSSISQSISSISESITSTTEKP
jgi:hypothetical protein